MKLNFRIWLLVSLQAVVTISRAQVNTTTTPTENCFLKLSALNLAYQALREPTNARQLWLTLQYESGFRPHGKTTYALIGEYITNRSNSTILTFRPQFRYYPGQTRFIGFFVGAYPTYSYRNNTSYDGRLFGAGIVIGYQYLIRKRIPIELNVYQGMETGHVRDYSTGLMVEGNQSYRTGLIEFNIGLPFRKRK
ncbi:MAG TPA: DUF3575 domain-containing protein [Cyclobacteriaceae bacterium]|nr:DUF3575 domain-containing protein [Cyclobacteriaceae bacterium]